MTDFSLRAARIQLGALLAALVLAIVIALGITAGAFVLSFAVQRDLAVQATIPADLAWIFPVIVDSAILGSTIAIVLISKLKMSGWDKAFYIALAVGVVVISVLGNAYHAFNGAVQARAVLAGGGEVGYVPLEPVVAALIAIVPPALVLAFTHGIGILLKATGIAYSDYRNQVDEHCAAITVDAEPDVSSAPQPAHGNDGNDIAPQRPSFDDFASTDAVVQNGMNADAVEEISAPALRAHIDPAPATDLPVDGDHGTDFDVEVERTDFDAEVGRVLDAAALSVSPVTDIFAELESFIADSELPESVKDTARRKLADPSLTWETIAQTSIPAVVTSTAWRRYVRFDTAAREAGFTSPPLVDLRAHENCHDDTLVAVG
ncbi:DUF2637 domain-containing protein [Rhodococcus erythropolis]|uniref:DUF2637 domain-containing protein n=1 Tax=Rhodococcus erythropolis TaxID=1833 RepID=UPI001C9B6131|nr:DUF2637 domain-containing protein [Rhodococcus erythropolis]MBY6382340.1 DUF2637 domain-containing protein [Rhodococcus erythropolis]